MARYETQTIEYRGSKKGFRIAVRKAEKEGWSVVSRDPMRVSMRRLVPAKATAKKATKKTAKKAPRKIEDQSPELSLEVHNQ